MSTKPSKNILPKIRSHDKAEKKTRNNTNKNNDYQTINSSQRSNYNKVNNINVQNLLTSTSVKVIDEVSKSSNRIDIIKKKIYKIIFVFRNEDFSLTVKLKTLIKDLKKEVCQLIGLNEEKLSLMYQDVEIDETYNDKTVDEYFDLKNIKFRPIVYIKRKFLIENGESLHFNLIPKNYDYKIKIQNIPSGESIDKIVNNFFKTYYSLKNNNNNLENMYNYKIENILLDDSDEKISEMDNHSYIVCFSSQDIAFDFNRYMSALKILNHKLKEVKSSIIPIAKKKIKLIKKPNTVKVIRYGVDYTSDEPNLAKRNIKILQLIRSNYLEKEKIKRMKKNYSQSNITGTGPYLSQIDKERIEMKENRKKWISPEGFISCVGKYSGIQI